jgi:hypothetical protein
VTLIERAGALPNDEFALYVGGDFRLRVLTSGGFSPDGVTGLQPDMFEDFFRLHAIGNNGKTVIMDRVGVDYEVKGGTLRVVGLSDLGQAEDPDFDAVATGIVKCFSREWPRFYLPGERPRCVRAPKCNPGGTRA